MREKQKPLGRLFKGNRIFFSPASVTDIMARALTARTQGKEPRFKEGGRRGDISTLELFTTENDKNKTCFVSITGIWVKASPNDNCY